MARERKTYDIKAGDVWQSEASARTDKITVVRETDSGVRYVKWKRVNTGTEGSALLPGYLKGRTLIERDGKPVNTPAVTS